MQSFTGCSIGDAAALPAASPPPGAALPVAAARPPHAAAPAAAAPLASAATTVTDPAPGSSLRPIATDVESELAAARGPSACSSVASSSSSSASSSVASSSSSSFSRESLCRAFSAWSTTATALPDPLHLPPLLPVPGAAVSAGGGSENFYSGAASQAPESPSPSPATAAAVSAAFFGAPEAAASPAGGASAACTGGGAAAGAASFSSSAAVAATNSPSSPFSGGSSPWFPLRAPRLSAAAAAAAASKRRCVRLQPSASPFPTAPPGGAPEAAADCVEVTALGAGSEVGRSCVLLQHRGYCVMFDCGVHPAHTGIGALPIFDAFDMRKVSVCLITHFHLDHCGALPYLLCKTSFRGRVFMTAPTKVISRLLWLDYARMAAFDDDRSSGGAAAAGTGGGGGRGAAGGAGGGGGGGAGAAAAGRSAAIYSEQDVEAALRMIETIDFHQEIEVQGIKISCYGAGHVLGACMFLVETGGVRTLYTGDFSSEEDRHVPAAELPAVDVQLLLCESTYGVQVHEPRQQRESRLIAAILEIVLQRRGKVLLPVFALGRVQELLLILEEYWRSHPAVQHVPILFISPLASKSIAVFDAFLHMSGRQLRQQALQGENPFAFQFVKSLKSYDGAAARLYVHRDAPAVIFAAPGMLQSGASRRIFEVLAPHARNGVILTGYSVKGTLAEELKREPEHLLLPRSDAGGGGGAGAAAAGGAATGAETDLQPQQQVLRRRCSCQVISFSAHSDYLQTSAFIKQLRVPNVVLVHGERNEMRRLRDKLQEETPDLAVFTPEILQTVSLQFCSSSSSGSCSSNTAATPAPVCAVAAGKLADEIFRGCGGGSEAAARARTQNSRSKASETASSSGRESEDEEEQEEIDGEEDLLLDVEGVVVLEEGEHPLLVHAEELSVAARIPVMRMQQKLRLAFPYPLCLLRKAAALVFEDCISFAAAAAPSHTSGTSAAAGTAAAALKSAAAAVGQSQQTEEEEEQGRSHAGSRKTLLCNGNSSGSSETLNAGSRSGAPSSAASRNSSDSSTAGQGSATTARRCSMTSSVEMVRGDGGASSSRAGTGSSAVPADAWHIGDEGNSDVGFCVGDCVSVYRHPRFAEEVVIEWLASPTADMVADALSFLLLDILRVNSSSNGCKQMQHLVCDREQQSDAVLVDVLQAQLSHIFGAVQVLPRSVHTAARAVAKAAALEAAPAAAPAEAAQVAAAGAAAGSAKAGPGGVVAANAGKDADTYAEEDAAGGRVDAAAEKTKGNFDSDEEPRQHHQQAQQQQRQQGEEEEEERRMRAAVERAELEQGEVVLRFWARRLTAAAAAGGLSSADGSSSAAQEPQAEEHPAAAAGAGKKPAFVLVPVEIDLAQRTVHCEDSEVRQRMQAFVRRVETSLLPLPVFS